jgi:hypothetical protein
MVFKKRALEGNKKNDYLLSDWYYCANKITILSIVSLSTV